MIKSNYKFIAISPEIFKEMKTAAFHMEMTHKQLVETAIKEYIQDNVVLISVKKIVKNED